MSKHTIPRPGTPAWDAFITLAATRMRDAAIAKGATTVTAYGLEPIADDHMRTHWALMTCGAISLENSTVDAAIHNMLNPPKGN